ncbi:MAG TPA: gamma-glutamylcyclotransferase family protein [Gammaproteobacteria bacterium]
MHDGLLNYFAYGSNLHPQRMRARVPSAQPLGCAVLNGHQLRFHKRSIKDGSAKCDAHYTGHPADRLYGAVYRIAAGDKPALDAIEGTGYGVVEQVVLVAGRRLPVFLYRARPECVAAALAPFDWYHALVLSGARHHGLPDGYIAMLEAVSATADPDPERAAAGFAQLRGAG